MGSGPFDKRRSTHASLEVPYDPVGTPKAPHDPVITMGTTYPRQVFSSKRGDREK